MMAIDQSNANQNKHDNQPVKLQSASTLAGREGPVLVVLINRASCAVVNPTVLLLQIQSSPVKRESHMCAVLNSLGQNRCSGQVAYNF